MTETGPANRTEFDITMVGETNLDIILYGLPESMPLERELLATGSTTTLGGSSSILAHNLATLGSRVGFVTEVGDDPLGKLALRFLEESTADLSAARERENRVTGLTVVLPHGAERHILTYPGVMTEMTVAGLDVEYLCRGRHFHLSSLFLQTGLQAGLPALFRTFRERGMTISMDTNDDPEDRWGGVLEELLDLVDVLLPNEGELLRITRSSSVEAALDALRVRVPLVVVKRGRRGATVQDRERRTDVPAVLVQPVDTVGAGDSFDAGFLHAYLGGSDPLAAAAFGNVTGALSTQRAGGVEAFRDRALRETFLARHVL